jgi:hypothetical protein
VTRTRLALGAAALLLAGPALARAAGTAPRPRCDSSRYQCAGERPDHWDRFVKVIPRPAPGQDAACLARLARAGVQHRILADVKGVRTPVELRGDRLGGVRYVKGGNNTRRFIVDCALAEALAVLGRDLRRAGIAGLYYSSTWRYTLVKGQGRLSGHAFGLALDVVAIEGSFGYASVVRHFERGRSRCGARAQSPRGQAFAAMMCALGRRRAFGTVFTPDSDAMHRDHVHLEGPSATLRLDAPGPRRTPRPEATRRPRRP